MVYFAFLSAFLSPPPPFLMCSISTSAMSTLRCLPFRAASSFSLRCTSTVTLALISGILLSSLFSRNTRYGGGFQTIHYIHGFLYFLYFHLFLYKQHFLHVRDVLHKRIITFMSSPHLFPRPSFPRGKGGFLKSEGLRPSTHPGRCSDNTMLECAFSDKISSIRCKKGVIARHALCHVIASPKGAAILFPRMVVQDCFVATLLAMTCDRTGAPKGTPLRMSNE